MNFQEFTTIKSAPTTKQMEIIITPAVEQEMKKIAIAMPPKMEKMGKAPVRKIPSAIIIDTENQEQDVEMSEMTSSSATSNFTNEVCSLITNSSTNSCITFSPTLFEKAAVETGVEVELTHMPGMKIQTVQEDGLKELLQKTVRKSHTRRRSSTFICNPLDIQESEPVFFKQLRVRRREGDEVPEEKKVQRQDTPTYPVSEELRKMKEAVIDELIRHEHEFFLKSIN